MKQYDNAIQSNEMMAMDKFGLIGNPISTSLSPLLFKAGYAGRYEYDLIEDSVFENAYDKFLKGYKAINVTAPFKEPALAKADMATNSCMKIGAANILLKTPDGVEAHNSDFTGIILCIAGALLPGIFMEYHSGVSANNPMIGIQRTFLESLPDIFPTKPEALVVGCGGAGRAAAFAAAELGFGVSLMNRTQSKAEEVAAGLGNDEMKVVPIDDFVKEFRHCDIIIYTIPTALEAISRLTAADFRGRDRYASGRPGKVILEANYKTPSFSGQILSRLEKYGCQYVTGRRWLLYQALTGYSIMTGTDPDFSAMAQRI